MEKYITVIGANFTNKGAEAMLLTVINELRLQYPQEEICAVIPFESKGKTIKIANVKYYCVRTDYIKGCCCDYLKKYSKCIIDISGFALSSKFGYQTSKDYLKRILWFQEADIPMYLLPQSFGPFRFEHTYQNLYVRWLLKRCMKYPKMICAREKQGYDDLKKYADKNLHYYRDIVLTGRGYAKLSLENNITDAKESAIRVKSRSVAIVPNEKLITHTAGANGLVGIYRAVVEELLKNSYNVYLLSHSQEDRKVCRQIKQFFREDEKVILVKKDFRCWEFESFIVNFDFLVASRYHSIVHAYRNSIPCLVIGWAEKYKELVHAVQQDSYFIDYASEYSREREIIAALQKLTVRHEKERLIIDKNRRGLRDKFSFESIVW